MSSFLLSTSHSPHIGATMSSSLPACISYMNKVIIHLPRNIQKALSHACLAHSPKLGWGRLEASPSNETPFLGMSFTASWDSS